MAKICPVCNKKIGLRVEEINQVYLHPECIDIYLERKNEIDNRLKLAEEETKTERGEICPVCNDDFNVRVDNVWYPISGIKVHTLCNNAFKQDLEHYGGANADLDTAIVSEEQGKRAEAERAEAERAEAERAEENFNIILEQEKRDETSLQEIKDKSVYIKDLDIPIKSMVIFMVKWAIASIPAFIILAVIGAVFFAIFASL